MAVYQIGGYHLTLELVRQILQDTDARVELPAEITRLAQMNGSTMTQAVAVTVFLRFSGLLPQCLPRLPAQRTRAIQETVDWIGQILERENNITCDNPLLFEIDNGQFEAVMGCNCSNTQVGYAMDLLSTLMAELGRGLMKQGSPAILWQRLATLAMQVSGDSIPTKGGQEDHVEFSYTAAEKAAESVCVLDAMLSRCSR
ncbi:MAG: aromatic amino acid ammonia-lyase [Oscillospiraceae bacterium]|nr:aromatic amino acid ammonia-lyase [Oscillospiraceae bacterium]